MPSYALSTAPIVLCLLCCVENIPIHLGNPNGMQSVFVASGLSTKAPGPSPVTQLYLPLSQVIVVVLGVPYCSPQVQTWLPGLYCWFCLRNGPSFLFLGSSYFSHMVFKSFSIWPLSWDQFALGDPIRSYCLQQNSNCWRNLARAKYNERDAICTYFMYVNVFCILYIKAIRKKDFII